MFKKLFGQQPATAKGVATNSAAAANKTISAIQSLTEHEESLEKRKSLLEKRVDAELEKAKDFTRLKKKPQALQCLKKKKLLENEISNLDNMIMRVNEQRMMLEGQRTTTEVVSSMHTAALAAKDNMKAMKIENVDKVLDEINETTDQMRQLNEVFANPLGLGTDLDDDELMNELEELEASELDKELLQPAPVPTARVPGATEKMPSVPQKQKQQPAKTQEELELEALQAEMALPYSCPPPTMSLSAASISGCSSATTLYTASQGDATASPKKPRMAGPLRSSYTPAEARSLTHSQPASRLAAHHHPRPKSRPFRNICWRMATASAPRLPSSLECAAPAAAAPAAADGAACALLPTSCGPESSQQRRWYSVLAELQSTPDPITAPEELVARLLREALHCVRGDEQWNCSGIAELLQRALEMSERGCIHSARKAAVGLLDFHKMVEKYRQVVAARTKSSSSGHSTSSGKRTSSEEMESDITEDACGPIKRQRTGGLEEAGSIAADENPEAAAQRSAEFAVPHLPAKKSTCAPVPSPAAAPVSAPSAPWSGNLWQSVPNALDLAYCKVSIPLPVECAKELSQGQSLEVAQLAPRRAVKLGRHRVCKCTILEASAAQLTKLKSMAQNELVALAPLESHGLILVPYVDNAGCVRMVCFCLTL
ncbi:Vacuolar protein sorting-associated protein 32 1 [Tetrabaena socialis]|uniref:Vacuolar protein sorting-associated protein 32 1 n=1 Tax=Tetrabaena socialis TaxID=47790 RepID=A0A2J7ZNA7_9CHLO|nr:Vacuolar protein sorting-associated protein 32 1 [Tetrabaena socialis]|eukprot:PNH01738.1 Vacuolar protein sorting-associated protein 32 1 [Tetrabaena socialis]